MHELDAERPAYTDAINDLAQQIEAGDVETLLILGGNPAYDAPAVLNFKERIADVATTVHLSQYDNETSHACTWHAPQAHWLESWGDARAWDGTLSLVQPLIEPLYGGRTTCELLALLLDDERKTSYEITRRTFGILFDYGVDRDGLWKQSLHDGVVAEPTNMADEPGAPQMVRMPERAEPDGFELVFRPDHSVYDGRFANNAWLQEWPDPITKLTWDNAAIVSASDARALGLTKNGDVIRIETAGVSIEIPAYILPGQPMGVVTLPLGYGRGASAGIVADGCGFRVNALQSTAAMSFVTGARITATGRHYKLVGTQDHHAIRSAVGDAEIQRRVREIVRETTLDEYKHHPDFATHVVHHPPLESLWEEKAYTDGHKWGMAIDLSKVHRLRGVRARLPGGEQHPRRRKGRGRHGPRDALDSHRPVFPGQGRTKLCFV